MEGTFRCVGGRTTFIVRAMFTSSDEEEMIQSKLGLELELLCQDVDVQVRGLGKLIIAAIP